MVSYERWSKRFQADTGISKRTRAEVDHGYDLNLEKLRNLKNRLNREARRYWEASGQIRDIPNNPGAFRPALLGEFYDKLTEDHIWPIHQGGGWGIENTRLLRESKNLSEHTRSEEEINRLLRIHKIVIHKFLATGEYDYYE
jgi:hypothetical protein